MWQDVLGTNEIGVCNNFFDLGGTSLSALRLVGAIKERYSVALSLRTLFSSGAIETVANEIAATRVIQVESQRKAPDATKPAPLGDQV